VSSLEAVRQEIRRETPRGSRARELIDELVRLEKRANGAGFHRNEATRLDKRIRETGDELQRWLRSNGMGRTAHRVGQAVRAAAGNVPTRGGL